jgi:hypothetical protein
MTMTTKKDFETNKRDAKAEWRKCMDDIIETLKANTEAVGRLEARFDIFCVEAAARQKLIDKHEDAIKGNGKAGLDQRVNRLEIYAAIIVGLTGTGVVGAVGYVIVKGVELVYTHSFTP